MDNYPIATFVFLILTIVSVILSFVLVEQLMASMTKTIEKPVVYKQKQDVANAFNNIVRAYKDCVSESDCVCDIYRLKFSSDYKISIEDVDKGVKVTLLDSNGDPLISETINNIHTGLMEKKGACSTGLYYVNSERKKWYIEQSDSPKRYYFFDDIYEIYKPNASTACLVTEELLYNLSLNDVKGFFDTIPRCTFKKKKKEERAFAAFNTFVEEFMECEKAGNCICDFSKISLPAEYAIRIESNNGTVFSLVKLRTRYERETVLLQLSSKSSAFIEEPHMLEFRNMKMGCIYADTDGAKLYNNCNKKNEAAKPLALFFDSNTGFLMSREGLLRLDGRVNRANIEYCKIKRKNVYNNIWPTEKLNKMYYYVEDCFGSTANGCNYGINILHNPGGVFAVDDGIVRYVNASEKKIVLKHKNGLLTEYSGVTPFEISVRMPVTRGQQIGTSSSLHFALLDPNVDSSLMQQEQVCPEGENKTKAVLVQHGGLQYVNPVCYFTSEIRDKIVYTAKCETPFKGCSMYGNEEGPKEDIKLRIAVIPVNWERKLSYTLFANNALEKFVRATPLKDCPSKLKKIFVDGKTDYGVNWSKGSCRVEGSNNCYKNALQTIKACAEQYKARTGDDYDFVVGVDDSDIACYPECDFADRGWTADNNDAAIVEAQYASDVAHELGHKFKLKDQYCDCYGTTANEFCGRDAQPNPLRKELGCGDNCCVGASSENYPYDLKCKWCKGNLDMNAKDTNEDNMLDSGKPTIMANYIGADSYSIDEYLYMKTQPKLQCT